MTRPRPIMDAVKYIGSAVSTALGFVNFLVTLNVISAEQADQVRELGVAIDSATPVLADSTSLIVASVSGLVTVVAGVAASFAAGKSAEGRTTPTEAPQDNLGRELTPSVP